jgi:hypothetical protein
MEEALAGAEVGGLLGHDGTRAGFGLTIAARGQRACADALLAMTPPLRQLVHGSIRSCSQGSQVAWRQRKGVLLKQVSCDFVAASGPGTQLCLGDPFAAGESEILSSRLTRRVDIVRQCSNAVARQ